MLTHCRLRFHSSPFTKGIAGRVLLFLFSNSSLKKKKLRILNYKWTCEKKKYQ